MFTLLLALVLLLYIRFVLLFGVRIVVHPHILSKLQKKHGVDADEVRQAFANRAGVLAREIRPQHRNGRRFWFISQTNAGRLLKIVFFFDHEQKAPSIITAYEPNLTEVELYEKIKSKKEK